MDGEEKKSMMVQTSLIVMASSKEVQTSLEEEVLKFNFLELLQQLEKYS